MRLRETKCTTCAKEMDERRDSTTSQTWFVDDVKQKLDWQPIENSFGIFCSRGCFSQKFWEEATESDREAMEDLARMLSLYQQILGTSYERFCLQHPALKLLLKPLSLWEINEGMTAIADAIGEDDEPKWFLKALGFEVALQEPFIIPKAATVVSIDSLPGPKPTVVEFASNGICILCHMGLGAHGSVTNGCPDGNGFYTTRVEFTGEDGEK